MPRHEVLWAGVDPWVVDEVWAALPEDDWRRLRAGAGSKGERGYDGQCLILAEPATADWGRDLLCRRSLTDPADGQADVVRAPRPCDLATLVRVAGNRWPIENALERAQQEVGLDEYEVRRAHGWARHITRALWALALLRVVRAQDRTPPPTKKKRPRRDSLTAFKRARGLAGG